MKQTSSPFLTFLLALPLEILLTVVFFMLPLLGVNAGNVNAYGWFPVIFVLIFSANHLRAKGWWGCCLYALAFLLWIPAVFIHYEASNLEWTLLVANLMALVVFLSVGKLMGTPEWASRALHRLMALFQACVAGLIYLLALKGVVWCVYTLWLGRPEFYLEREHPQLLLFLGMLMYFVCGLVLCWRLWAKPVANKRREVALKVCEYLLLAGNVLFIIASYVVLILTMIKGTILFDHQGYCLLGGYMLLALGLLARYARGEWRTPKLAQWFYRYLPMLALPSLALLWFSALVPVAWFGLSAPRIFLLIMAGIITIYQCLNLFCRTVPLLRATLAVILALALFTFVPGIKMEQLALRNQIARYESALPTLEEKGVLAGEDPYPTLYDDDELADALTKACAARAYLSYHLPRREYEATCGEAAKVIVKFDQTTLNSMRKRLPLSILF